MRPFRGLCFAALLFPLALTACDDDEGLTADDLAAFRRMEAAHTQATLARDFDAILAQRTDSAVWMPPDAPALKGKAAIRAFLESGPPAVRFDLTPIHADGRDDLAYVRGRYVYAAAVGADTVTETGKYLALMRRQPDGTWLIGLEMWNSDAPPPAPAPPPAVRPSRR